MNSVKFLLITDNDHGLRLSEICQNAGFSVLRYPRLEDIASVDFESVDIYVLLIDLIDVSNEKIIGVLSRLPEPVQNCTKFVILEKSNILQAVQLSGSLRNIEFLERPCHEHEFLVLSDKSVIVEKYRRTLADLSHEYEGRIDNYERVFAEKKESLMQDNEAGTVFRRVLDFEKKLLQKQNELNMSLKELSAFNKRDLEEVQNQLYANQMLDLLREKELKEARELIEAQERVLEFSTVEMDELKRMLDAQQKVVELSRDEALSLHTTINKLINEKNELTEKNQQLTEELTSLRRKGDH